ncbi:MAG: bifunctional nuclease family protein [Methylacidiphilales bacterium]|nr:bifunctional nuclease family protein [Candidatus Methylacidiphilales bacterium]MDW8349327.1 bifunctional nuclease family protein [Verrucomicrobiae bacterium]
MPLQNVVPIQLLGLFATKSDAASLFLGNEEKAFVISVDVFIGSAIARAATGEKSGRPLTHDLMHLIFQGFDIKLDHVVINEVRDDTFYARAILRMENELGKKIIEVDARPSDCITLALLEKAPMYVARNVWDNLEDASDYFEKLKNAPIWKEGEEQS